jgi:protein-disulfide isomerase
MNDSSSKSKLYWFLAAASTIGAAVSIWQTRLFFLTRSGMGEMKSFCNIGQTFDCTAVEMSNYAEMARGIPLSGVAIAGYLVILILSLLGLNDRYRRNLKPYLVIFTGIAFLFSAFYLLIMLTQIGKLCILCLGVDSINVVLFVLALTLPKAQAVNDGTKPTTVIGIGALSLILVALLVKGMNPQDGVKQEDVNDILDSILASPVNALEIPADAPSIGDSKAPVTIVKFSDFECPACKMGANAIHPLFKRYSKDVRFVFLNFPLAQECNPDPQLKRTIHVFACEAAAVAVCATEQGKFSETYETLFENQRSFEAGKIADLLASKVQGIDLPKLKECMKLPSTSDKIKRDSSLGMSLKVQSTPTFFLNGKKVEGGLPTNIWVQLIDRVLQK